VEQTEAFFERGRKLARLVDRGGHIKLDRSAVARPYDEWRVGRE